MIPSIVHLYFGDAANHPIIQNYVRDQTSFQHEVISGANAGKRVRRIWILTEKIWQLRKRADCVLHCHDFATAFIAALLIRKPWIYDSHEVYSSFFTNPLVSWLIARVERFSMRRARHVLFPSTFRRSLYPGSLKSVHIVENLYFPYDENLIPDWSVPAPIVKNGSHIKFFYAGLINSVRAIEEIVAAFKDPRMQDRELFLAGPVEESVDIDSITAVSNVHYLGVLPHAHAVRLLHFADGGFVIYKPVNENNRRCAPTKLFEYLYHGVSVVALASPYIKEVGDRFPEESVIESASVSIHDLVEACIKVRKNCTTVSEETRMRSHWRQQSQLIRSIYLSTVAA